MTGDQIPDDKLRMVLGMLGPDWDRCQARAAVIEAWLQGFRSIVGIHGKARHLLEYGNWP